MGVAFEMALWRQSKFPRFSRKHRHHYRALGLIVGPNFSWSPATVKPHPIADFAIEGHHEA